ncbi:RrF2 family transcriptional regulator [Spirochaeta isovalerica]|uniref:Rrf2 family protein n=1 Tax=Spirochaeta isovalerica TaxID=150 RepID=A0A841RDK2_9SPIO|nr:Rrf2 family transcriptional regulator [Spirochaeta isovalerica]MBB6481461.1 Rrf2 family protein [Spirochaeta isovalerica]
MKLSTRSRYAARAIIEIAKQTGDKPITRKSICESQEISSSYLENILIVLKNQGIIKTIRGPRGGYVLAKDPEEISMYEIVKAFEGSISAVHCVDDPKNCPRYKDCPTKIVWEALMKSQKDVLDSFNIKDLMMRSENQISPEYLI